MSGTRLAVLGDPVAHSKSPALHAAAYRVLGLDWSYTAVELPAIELGGFVDELGDDWRGLSLTMPHKQVVLPLLDEREELVEIVGAANTLLFDGPRRLGFNTDVEGIVRALADHGVTALETVQILGGGATARSALAAVARLGARRVEVSVRDPERAADLTPLAERLGLELALRPFAAPDAAAAVPDLVLSTLPGHAEIELAVPEATRARAVLLDVAYEPWPSRLATAWQRAGGRVVSGLEMLLHQAIGQVRIFATGSRDGALPDEAAVVAAMRDAVGLSAPGSPRAPGSTPAAGSTPAPALEG
ncbi:MAG: shikimate dehydrogenase [Actinomycetales bacterium]|nr:shikimate dehydrogenase [Actinomycetales bacterium]